MLFSFLKHNPDSRYGVIVDIGSASVGLAVVVSDPLAAEAEVLWTYRERMIVHELFDQEGGQKHIATALLNAFLELGSVGLKKLREHKPSAKIDSLFFSISAPWSYTINSQVSINAENPFIITHKLIEEMLEKAAKETEKKLKEHQISELFNLETVTEAVVDVTANGYHITEPLGKETKKLTISQIKGVTSRELVKNIHIAQEKILPDTILLINTFMYNFYLAMQSLRPDTSEVCLIDITSEATEIGIIRDGVLTYTSHITHGNNSIAREISELTKVPHAEALGFMRSNGTDLTKSMSESKREAMEAILHAYEEKLTKLMTFTGDTLSIPKTIFLHTDLLTEAFFSERIKNAAHKATGARHAVHFVTSKFFTPEEGVDTPILLSTHVFHKKMNGSSQVVL